MEKHLPGGRFFLKDIADCILGPIALLIDEFAADRTFGGQPADRRTFRQRPDGQILPLRRSHRPGQRETRGLGLRKDAGDVKIEPHVCFLRETG